jgi:hypothetical protein
MPGRKRSASDFFRLESSEILLYTSYKRLQYSWRGWPHEKSHRNSSCCRVHKMYVCSGQTSSQLLLMYSHGVRQSRRMATARPLSRVKLQTDTIHIYCRCTSIITVGLLYSVAVLDKVPPDQVPFKFSPLSRGFPPTPIPPALRPSRLPWPWRASWRLRPRPTPLGRPHHPPRPT